MFFLCSSTFLNHLFCSASTRSKTSAMQTEIAMRCNSNQGQRGEGGGRENNGMHRDDQLLTRLEHLASHRPGGNTRSQLDQTRRGTRCNNSPCKQIIPIAKRGMGKKARSEIAARLSASSDAQRHQSFPYSHSQLPRNQRTDMGGERERERGGKDSLFTFRERMCETGGDSTSSPVLVVEALRAKMLSSI